MTKLDPRYRLRERAFQALLSIEFGRELNEALSFAYWHDREEVDEIVVAQTEFEVPSFMKDLVEGVSQNMSELDKLLLPQLKSGWTLERLSLVDKTLLRLGLYEVMFYQETPDRVAVNEIIELAKRFSDKQAPRFINGVLTHFVKED